MDRMKKGQLSTQFAWIFILIAGALILIFFISIVYKQKDISETKISATVKLQLDTIFTAASVSAGTVNQITTPDMEMNFVCDEDGYSRYDIAKTSIGKDTPEVIFAPDVIKGRKIISWALGFNAPFKVMNFLYLTSEDVRYIFVFNEGNNFANGVYEDFPDEMFKEEVRPSETLGITDLKSYQTKFIVFSGIESIELPSFFNGEDVSAIKITPANVIFYETFGSLDFTSTGNFPYFDKALRYGAIFSEDATFYECNVKKAMKKLNFMSQIYAERETQLKLDPTCELFYQEKIAKLMQDASQCSNIKTCIPLINADVKEIENNQKILIRKSCPLLY